MTAPVILALQKANEDERAFWTRTLAGREQDDSDLIRAQSIISRHGALADGNALARSYAEKAREALAEAPDSPLRATLDALAFYAVNRER